MDLVLNLYRGSWLAGRINKFFMCQQAPMSHPPEVGRLMAATKQVQSFAVDKCCRSFGTRLIRLQILVPLLLGPHQPKPLACVMSGEPQLFKKFANLFEGTRKKEKE